MQVGLRFSRELINVLGQYRDYLVWWEGLDLAVKTLNYVPFWTMEAPE